MLFRILRLMQGMKGLTLLRLLCGLKFFILRHRLMFLGLNSYETKILKMFLFAKFV